ncbi:hypothetical protein GN956_G15682 [Arapaima gigas]
MEGDSESEFGFHLQPRLKGFQDINETKAQTVAELVAFAPSQGNEDGWQDMTLESCVREEHNPDNNQNGLRLQRKRFPNLGDLLQNENLSERVPALLENCPYTGQQRQPSFPVKLEERPWHQQRCNLEVQLRKGSKELELLNHRCQLLEKEGKMRSSQGDLKQKNLMLEAQMAHQSQLLVISEDVLATEKQTLTTAKDRLTAEEHEIRTVQGQEAVLQCTVQCLQEDLERGCMERSYSLPESSVTRKEVTPEIQGLSQRVNVLEHSLRNNVSTFAEFEAKLHKRIKELEASERNLLVKVDNLALKTSFQDAAPPQQRQHEKLHMLREEVQNVTVEKERSKRVWRERLRRCQDQLRMKEEEMKRHCEYFELYKQKQHQKISLARDREQGLQKRIQQLEQEAVDLTTTTVLLRTELERRPSGGTPRLDEEVEKEHTRLKGYIHNLQEDLQALRGCNEVGEVEQQALRERLQWAEDNVEFLSHQLMPQLSAYCPCSCKGLLGGSFLTLLEMNSLSLVDIMQALRCGGVKEVNQTLQKLKLQNRLPLLLVSASEHKDAMAFAEQQGPEESPHGAEQSVPIKKEKVPILPQPDMLRLLGTKNQKTDISSLRDKKKELEALVHSKDKALERVSDENAGLKENLAESHVNRGACVVTETKKDELDELETQQNNWRQENKVFYRYNEELLGKVVQLKRDYEQKLAQLRLQISLQKLGVGELLLGTDEQLHSMSGVQKKEDEDLGTIVLVQHVMEEKEGGTTSQEENRSNRNMSSDTAFAKLGERRKAFSPLVGDTAQQHILVLHMEDEKQGEPANTDELKELVTSGLTKNLQETSSKKQNMGREKYDECLVKVNHQLTKKLEDLHAVEINAKLMLEMETQNKNSFLKGLVTTLEMELMALRGMDEIEHDESIQEQEEVGNIKNDHKEQLRKQQRFLQTFREKNQELLVKTGKGKRLESSAKNITPSQRTENSTLASFSQMTSGSDPWKSLKCDPTPKEYMNSIANRKRVSTFFTCPSQQDVHRVCVELRLLQETQKPPQFIAAKETEWYRENKMAPAVTHRSHTIIFSYKTVSLAEAFQEKPGSREGVEMLRRELEATAADLGKCQEELEKAKTEAQRWYRELGLAESRREEADKKASQALNEVRRMRECIKQAEGMKSASDSLKKETKDVKARVSQLEKELSDALLLRSHLEEQLAQLQVRFDAKCAVEQTLRAEKTTGNSQQDDLKNLSAAFNKLKARYNDAKHQIDEFHKKKTQADIETAPLKAKLSCIVQKCQERNSMIVRMVRTLRRYGCVDHALTQEAEDMVNDTALLEYSSTFRPTESAAQVIHRIIFTICFVSSSEKSLTNVDTSLSFRPCVAKTDYCPSPHMPQTILPTLPLWAGQQVQVTGLPDTRGLYHAQVDGEIGLIPARFLEEREGPAPQTATLDCTGPGQSRRLTGPERILELHRQLQQVHCGKHQVTHSPPPTDCSSECGGTGRTAGRSARLMLNNGCSFRDNISSCGSPEAPSRHLCSQSTSGHQNQDSTATSPDTLCPDTLPTKTKLDPPAAVGSVDVIKMVGQSSLMIGWERPPLDDLGCSNGTFVYGYRVGFYHIYLFSQVMSLLCCPQVVLDNLDLFVPLHISVQTLGSNGLLAEKVHVLFQGSILPAGTALSSTNQAAPLTSPKSWTLQPFVATYNYSPLKDSPNIHPSRELGFREGDAVWVFSAPRRDGFCEAEVNGRRGLAPMAFLKEVGTGLCSQDGALGSMSFPPVASDGVQSVGFLPPCPASTPLQRRRSDETPLRAHCLEAPGSCS